jgi:hypothetical protein
MNIDTNIILEYFECMLVWTNDVPKVTIKLKDKYKIRHDVPFRPHSSKKIPYSSVEYGYYKHYLGNSDLTRLVYDERKKLSSKHSQLRWWIDNNTLDGTMVDKINHYLNTLGHNLSKKLKEHYNSEVGVITKEKLKKRSQKWASVIGNMNSMKWNDDEWRIKK